MGPWLQQPVQNARTNPRTPPSTYDCLYLTHIKSPDFSSPSKMSLRFGSLSLTLSRALFSTYYIDIYIYIYRYIYVNTSLNVHIFCLTPSDASSSLRKISLRSTTRSLEKKHEPEQRRVRDFVRGFFTNFWSHDPCLFALLRALLLSFPLSLWYILYIHTYVCKLFALARTFSLSFSYVLYICIYTHIHLCKYMNVCTHIMCLLHVMRHDSNSPCTVSLRSDPPHTLALCLSLSLWCISYIKSLFARARTVSLPRARALSLSLVYIIYIHVCKYNASVFWLMYWL